MIDLLEEQGMDRKAIFKWAIEEGHNNIIIIVGVEGIDVNAADDIGTTPLIHAVNYGYYDIVFTLLGNPNEWILRVILVRRLFHLRQL